MLKKNNPLFFKSALIFAVFIAFSLIQNCFRIYGSNVSADVIYAETVSDKLVAFNDVDGLEDEFLFLIAEHTVSIASKNSENAHHAPSVITVITDKEIENMGFRTLSDILRIVPGFDILKDSTIGHVLMDARGVREADRKIKIHIDGHSINAPYDGETSFLLDKYPLVNVKRIEIIRGPGSALYGANAFLAVINIISKDAADIDGVKLSAGIGSFDSQEYSILFGKDLYGVDVSGFADFTNTNGLSEVIKADRLTGSPFTVTPSDTDDSRNELDLFLKLVYKNLKLVGKYMNKDQDVFIGAVDVKAEDGEYRFNNTMADLSYEFDLGDKITVKPRAYYDQYYFNFFPEIFPPGFTIDADTDGDGDIEVFADGLKADAVVRNRRVGGEIQLDYKLSDKNLFVVGFNYEWENQDNVTYHTNFHPITNASFDGQMVDMTNTANLLEDDVLRQIWAIYLQDKWDVTDNLGITVGVRHDHYSDFEGTTNPRLGIVWDFMDDATLKILYGQAFHAPSFKDLYATNNPVTAGNPNMKPETIRTYEVALEYDINDNMSANVNYFFNVIRDEIGFRDFRTGVDSGAGTFILDNLGGSNIQGVEFEFRADLNKYWKGAYAFANYTYQDAEAKGDPLPDVPKHKGNIGVNFELTKYVNANLHSFISGDRIRAETDTRDDSPGYALVNLTMTIKEFFKDMKIKASMFNLLDKDYNDPAPLGGITHDLPRPGRTFFIEMNYKF